MARGDHVWVRRAGYTHHGVQIDDDSVIHFSGEPRSKRGATVRLDPLEEFADGGSVEVRSYGNRLPVEVTVERAKSKVGEARYNLLRNNCEHFAQWCVADWKRSRQVDQATATGAVVGVSSAAAAGGVGVVAGVGEVAGLSGAGIMSGLATTGVGGAVGGLATLGAAPAAITVAVMQVALRDNSALRRSERTARKAGRRSSVAGAAAGTATGIGAVGAAGTVSGLSAAGISSGLAAIGGVAGGGMAAGTAIVITGPAVAAAAGGYGVYRTVRWWRQRDDEASDTPASGESKLKVHLQNRLHRLRAGGETSSRT